MKDTLGLILMICSPFIAAGVILAGLKGMEKYSHWRYQRAVEKRNAKLERLSITPFRGAKVYDDRY